MCVPFADNGGHVDVVVLGVDLLVWQEIESSRIACQWVLQLEL